MIGLPCPSAICSAPHARQEVAREVGFLPAFMALI
jgi:hypothetical protein